jgi:ribonuclease PH
MPHSMEYSGRHQDRPENAIRPVQFERRITKHAAGSVLVKLGDTHVWVTATVEERVPRHVQQKNQELKAADKEAKLQGWITAEYNMLPAATHPRNTRERLKLSGRTQEIQRLIGRSLRACVDMTLLGERSITIDADVLQADGGTRTASITGAYVALVDAIECLKTKELLDTEVQPIKFPIAAISVGVVHGVPLLDLDYSEDSTADVDANVVMSNTGDIIEFQTSSESAPLPKAMMGELLNLGESGVKQLIAAQEACLGVPVGVAG